MLKLIGKQRAERILEKYAPWLRNVSNKYAVPVPVIKAVLYQEMTDIDILDAAADLVVWTGLFPKKDSSTGYAQIFGYVAVNAVNFAVDRGLTDYAALGIPSDHRLNSADKKDVRMLWKLLRRDRRLNMEAAALNILSAAEEMTDRRDFSSFSDRELQLIFTRYNADIRCVSPYGQMVYSHYLRYKNAQNDLKDHKEEDK